ncbi:glutamine amidotransferase [Rhodopirellula sp. JC740]|uniref:Glutamine amidotransferase n=1 Tax=Rhodopirellula halodulae TaxID=2894198 RepID=A0ABS8NG09_9BACT|nr:glutamine amidotransferase [Rhodopirellula sp. JC740]MCC9642484.1 glutamine amidotransferase [Rhodopirellula sp. JC740]
MAKVYYVGDWAVMLGPVFAETPFNYTHKGTEIFNYGTWLKEAFESTGRHEVTSVPTWDFYRLGPGEFEDVLAEYDVLVFSDVEAKNFQLAPQFFDRSKFGNQPLTFPDRVRLTVEAIEGGTHAMFLGGWLSFNGEMGKGGWGRTGLKNVLPVTCLEIEDLRESTEGFTGQGVAVDHPVIAGVDLESMPPILGYNIVKPREGCDVIASWKETGDPLLSVGQFGKGRVLSYMSDPAPHWGCNFVYWDGYQKLWSQALDWLLDGTH